MFGAYYAASEWEYAHYFLPDTDAALCGERRVPGQTTATFTPNDTRTGMRGKPVSVACPRCVELNEARWLAMYPRQGEGVA